MLNTNYLKFSMNKTISLTTNNKINKITGNIRSNTIFTSISNVSSKSINFSRPYVVYNNKTYNKINHLYFSKDNFNANIFIESIMTNLFIDNIYTIFIKVGFEGNTIFYMCGSQIGIKILSSHDIAYYTRIYNIIDDRIEDIMSKYDMPDYPDSIIISYKKMSISKDIKFDNIKSISINNKIINKTKIKKYFSSNYLPLTNNIKYFGNLIESDLRNHYLKILISNIESSGLKVSDYLKNIILLNKFKLLINNKKKGQTHLILDINITDVFNIPDTIKWKGNNFLKFNLNLNKNYKHGNLMLVYDLNTGVLLCEALDITNNVDNETFIRQIQNYSLTISKSKIIEINRGLFLETIKNPRLNKPYQNMVNPNFGVLDLETFIDTDGLAKVYNIGFVTLLEKDKINTFYLSDLHFSLDSNFLIILCVDSMLKPKYHNYIWYIHNMGNFDIVFLYKVLREFNLHNKKDYYKLEALYKDNKMLRLIIKIKDINNKYIKITFVDSLNILNSSLSVLAKDFKVSTQKGIFPYSFVTKDNLNYRGPTPDIKLYNNISDLEYNLIYTDDWSLKIESNKYLEKDLLSLLEVLDKFNISLYINHGIQMTEGLTISRLALNKFLYYYLENSKLPLINKFNYFNFIYFGYYGGITEVYKPHGKNLNYYDVNSLYPFVSLNSMPGNEVNYLESFTDEGLDLDNLFGFFQAEVKTNNQYLGLLPIKTNKGLIQPNGVFEGIWSSEELKFAKSKGYEIKIKKGYNFNKEEKVFEKYVKDLYKEKAISKGSERVITKSLLNNLLGRFGLNIIKPVTKSLNKENLDYIISTREIKSIQEITENDFLVTYNPIINKNICIDHGIDYIKILNKENNQNLEKNLDIFNDVSVALSAMITSYARIFMNNIKLEILNKGGNIYYMDTDSLIIDIDLKTLNLNLVGNDLGQFKLEYLIKEALFISNKTYCLKLYDDSLISKAKGIKKDSLNWEDFQSMFFKSKNQSAIKIENIKNLSKGSTIIKEKEIVLNYDAYTKRQKLYNKEGLWFDTKPLKVDKINGVLTYENSEIFKSNLSIVPYSFYYENRSLITLSFLNYLKNGNLNK